MLSLPVTGLVCAGRKQRLRGREMQGAKGNECMDGAGWPQTDSAPAWRRGGVSQLSEFPGITHLMAWQGAGTGWVLCSGSLEPTGHRLAPACQPQPHTMPIALCPPCSVGLVLSPHPHATWPPSSSGLPASLPMAYTHNFLVLFHLRRNSSIQRGLSSISQHPSAEELSPARSQWARLWLPVSHLVSGAGCSYTGQADFRLHLFTHTFNLQGGVAALLRRQPCRAEGRS